MLVGAKSYAESASAVPDVVAGVVIHPVGNGERYSVEEHVTREALVRLRGHNDAHILVSHPAGQNNDIPVAIVDVDIVSAAAECTDRAAYLQIGRASCRERV